jgi:predicted amidohydrolase
MPVADGKGGFLNRAHLFLPDGREIIQDKLCLTPAERDPAAWFLETGTEVTVVEWEGLRFATLICLDIELPALAARLAPLDLDLILVPSMTSKLSGFHRVFGCARARAIELMTTVCAVGAIGVPERLTRRESNTSAACRLSAVRGGAGIYRCSGGAVADTTHHWRRTDVDRIRSAHRACARASARQG